MKEVEFSPTEFFGETDFMSTQQNDLNHDEGSTTASRRDFLATGLLLPIAAVGAQAQPPPTKAGQEVLALSKEKWSWMSERKEDPLAALFHEEAFFVHMGATMSKKQEIDTVRGGMIQYKTVEIRDASVRIIGATAIVLSTIRLVAVVGGNEVTNPFVVTEVYVKQKRAWKLVQLSFTRTLG
jgi:hypothetical protein